MQYIMISLYATQKQINVGDYGTISKKVKPGVFPVELSYISQCIFTVRKKNAEEN